MRIISFIEDEEIIKNPAFSGIKHLELWDVRPKPPPCANDQSTEAFIICDESSSPDPDDYLMDADYPMEAYL